MNHEKYGCISDRTYQTYNAILGILNNLNNPHNNLLKEKIMGCWSRPIDLEIALALSPETLMNGKIVPQVASLLAEFFNALDDYNARYVNNGDLIVCCVRLRNLALRIFIAIGLEANIDMPKTFNKTQKGIRLEKCLQFSGDERPMWRITNCEPLFWGPFCSSRTSAILQWLKANLMSFIHGT